MNTTNFDPNTYISEQIRAKADAKIRPLVTSVSSELDLRAAKEKEYEQFVKQSDERMAKLKEAIETAKAEVTSSERALRSNLSNARVSE